MSRLDLNTLPLEDAVALAWSFEWLGDENWRGKARRKQILPHGA